MGRDQNPGSKNVTKTSSSRHQRRHNEHRTVPSMPKLDPSAAAFTPGHGESESRGTLQDQNRDDLANSSDTAHGRSPSERTNDHRVSASGASQAPSASTPPMQRRSASENSVPGRSAPRSNPGSSNRGSKRNSRKGGARLDASEFFPSRSPVNPSHLLGFRQGADSHEDLPRPRGINRKKHGGRATKQTFKKEHFLQASFRFVVSDAVDVAKHSSDPDAMFDWDDVLQVEVSLVSPLQCPITLETPPIVPVVTGCGHIFSLPAIVHCMLSEDGDKLQAATCPLCHNSIVPRDLRLVTTRTISPPPDPSKHDQVTFTLIRRPRDSILPAPVECDAAELPSGGSMVLAAMGVAAAVPPAPTSTLSRSLKGMPPPAPQPKAAPPDPPAEDSRSKLDQESPLAQHRHKFAKYVTCSNALPAMRAAAAALAHYAAIIVASGGIEAEVEGPSLFKSMDLLADRARAWTLRRFEALASGTAHNIVGACTKDDAADEAAAAAAAEAEQVVRDVFQVCMADERSQNAPPEAPSGHSEASKAVASERDDAFPALPAPRHSTSTPPGTDSTRAGGHTSQSPGGGPSNAAAQLGNSRPGSVVSPLLQEPRRQGGWMGGGGSGAEHIHSDESDHHGANSGGNSQRDLESPLAEEDDVGALQFEFDEGPQHSQHAARGVDRRTSDTGSPLATLSSGAAHKHARSRTGRVTSESAGLSGGVSEEGAQGGVGGGNAVAAAQPPGEKSPAVGSLDESIRLLGSSPHAGVSVNQMTGGDYFMYQVADGSWMFLHPINVRALLHHHGSFEKCPPTLSAPVLEVEAHSQTPTTRRKLEPMAHIPITSEFRLIEIDLSGILPEDSIAPFQNELAARAERRERELAKIKKEEEKARAAAERLRKPAIFSGLSAMPLPHEADMRAQIANDSALAAALAASPPLVTPESDDVTSIPVATTSNASTVSYAQLARLGYAAPTGPVVGQQGGEERGPSGHPPGGASSSTGGGQQPCALSSSPPVAAPMGAWGSGAGAAAASKASGAPKGAWGRKAAGGRGGAVSAGVAPGARSAVATGDLHASEDDPEPVVRRNKKGYKVVMLTHGGRI